MKKKQQTKSIVELIFAALFYQLGRDFCVQHNVAPSNPLYSAMRKKDCVFVFDALIAILSIRQQHSASAPIEQWLEHHDPAELLDVCKECLLCRMPDEAAQYEDAFQVLSKVINDAPEIAADILNYLRDHPYTSVLPYQVLGIQHAPWRKTKIVRRVGIGFSAHEWTDSAHDEKSSLFIVNLCANYSYHYYQAPEGYCPSFINRPLTEDELKWITLKPHGDQKKGQHIQINVEKGKEPTIESGLDDKFKGKPLSVLRSNNKKQRSSQQERAGASTQQGRIKSETQSPRQAYSSAGSSQATANIDQLLAEQKDNFARLTAGFSKSDLEELCSTSLDNAPSASQAPLSYYYFCRELRENDILLGKTGWYSPAKYDCIEQFSDPDEQAKARACFNAMARGAYAFSALKRCALARNEPLSKEQIELGELFNLDYQVNLQDITVAHARKMAHVLAHCAKQLGSESLIQARHLAKENICTALMEVRKNAHDLPPSLLSLIGTKSNSHNPFYDEYNDPAIYAEVPNSLEKIESSKGLVDNPAFNNLINAVALNAAVPFNPKAPSGLKTKVRNLLHQANVLYLESHDGLPLSVGLNRDLATLTQKQSRYGKHTFFANLVNGVPRRNYFIDVEEWLSENARHYDYIITSSGFRPFAFNCQAGAVAFELFIRGYEVVARPNMKNDRNLLPDLSLHPNLIWYNPIIKTAPDIRPLTNLEQLYNLCYFGERYNLIVNAVSIDPKSAGQTSAHIVTVARNMEDMEDIVIIDPQTASYGSIYGFQNWLTNNRKVRITKLSLFRIDNCEFFIDYANRVVRAPSAQPVLDAKRS